MKSRFLIFSLFLLIFVGGCGSKVIESGHYVVGEDMKPGLYRVEPAEDGEYSFFSFDGRSLLSLSPAFVEVSEEQKVVFGDDTIVYKYSESQGNKPKNNKYQNDMYLVGRDIKPGDYVFQQVSDEELGYVTIYKDLNYTDFSEVETFYIMQQEEIALEKGYYVLMENTRIIN